MNTMARYVLQILVLCPALRAGFFPLDYVRKQTAQFFVSELDAKQQQLTRLGEEFDRLQQANRVFEKQFKQEESEIKKQLVALDHESSAELIQKKQALLEEIKQNLSETYRWRKQSASTVKKIIDVLKTYLENPQFSDVRSPEKSLYTIEQLYTAAQQTDAAAQELANVKKDQERIEQEYQQVNDQRDHLEQELKQKTSETRTEAKTVRGDFLALDIDRLHKKIAMLEIKKQVLEKERELALLNEFIASKKLNILEKDLTQTERLLWVADQDVQRAKSEFDAYKSEQAAIKENYLKELTQLTNARGRTKDDEQLKMLDEKIALIDARQALVDTNILHKELDAEIVSMWRAVSQRRFLHDDADKAKRLTFLNTKKTEIEQQIKTYTGKSIGASTERVQIYNTIIRTLSQLDSYLSLVIQKLSSSNGILQRSSRAITREGIKNFGADAQFFVQYVISSLMPIEKNISTLIARAQQAVADINFVLNLLFFLVVVLICYFLGAILLPLLQQLLHKHTQQHGTTSVLTLFSCLLSFVQKHLFGGVLWALLFYSVRYDAFFALSAPIKIIFYLCSIGYLWYLLTRFTQLYRVNNQELLNKIFVKRFVVIIYTFLVVTIATYFLSEAFVTVVYGYSAFTRTLWALYSLIVRALIVFLVLDKGLIIALIPERGAVWDVVRERLVRYYYLFILLVLALVILSDPFVGYGRLVSAVVEATILTIAVVVLLRLVYGFLRQYSSQLFFVTSEDIARERFAHSRTWYALFIVVSLGVLIVGALILFARIWGYPISFATLGKFFNTKLIEGESGGTRVAISIKSLIELVVFIFSGVLISSLFERYVLQRLYTLTHVEPGVQNTISRISGYIFVVVPLIFGLQYIGLGMWNLWAVPLLMLIVAWAGRGPADDFFAYFIILVEQSVKIGDFIRLDSPHSDMSGVVRKITPRSVVLRRRSSYAVIIPNSKLMRSTIYNWNYSHNYFGFDDILMTVDYATDPQLVREILLKILNNNQLILKSPIPVIRVENFSINGYEVRVRGFLSSSQVLNQWDIRSDVRCAILKEFKAAGVKLAPPIQSVKLETIRSTDDQ